MKIQLTPGQRLEVEVLLPNEDQPWWLDWPSIDSVVSAAVAKERERCLAWVRFAETSCGRDYASVSGTAACGIRDGREIPK